MLLISEIKSTKSWVKLPKTPRLFNDESAYESISSLEPANHEFESYTRNHNFLVNREINRRKSVEYGFRPQHSPSSSFDHHPAIALNTISNLTSASNSNQPKHSTLNQNLIQCSSISSSSSTSDTYFDKSNINKIQSRTKDNRQKREISILYSKILGKLANCSIEQPANLPLLCTKSFNRTDLLWNQMGNRFKLSGLNVRLIELNQGVPLNAMFYLSDLDLVYVRSYDVDANELEGYLPRNFCRPIYAREPVTTSGSSTFNTKKTGDADSCLVNSDEYSLATNTNTLSTNDSSSGTGNGREDRLGKQSDELANDERHFKSISNQKTQQRVEEVHKLNENDDDDSVKYHSLSTAELEYDDLNEDQVQVEQVQPSTNIGSIQTKQIKDCVTYELNNITHTVQNCAVSLGNHHKYVPQVDSTSCRADSTHFSIANYQLVNDYEDTTSFTHANSKLKEESSLIDRHEISPKSLNQCLLSLQSRSRLPISIKSNLNLPIMDDQRLTNSNACNNSKLSFSNITYNSPSVQYTHQYTSVLPKIHTPKSANKSEFERSYMRRSLDSSLAFGGACGAGVARDNRFYAISIDIEGNENANSMDSSVYNRKILNSSNRKLDIPQVVYEKRALVNEQFADLDLKRIELDSLKDSNQATPTTPNIVHKRPSKINPHKILEEPEDQLETPTKHQSNISATNLGSNEKNNVWTVILQYDAQNFQELSVKPGMLVMIIREYETWLYVKMIGYENSQLNKSQQYGIIPRNCAVNLHELLNKNQSLLSASTQPAMPTSTHQTKTGQISQITAL